MRDRGRPDRAHLLRLAGGVAALALTLAGCSDSEPSSGPTDGESSSESSSSAPTSAAPEPKESVALYELEKPRSNVEGKEQTANEAVRDFAGSMSSGDRDAVEKVLYAPTPQDQPIVDQSLRVYEGADWDFSGLRWTKDGVHGPCYLLQGTVDGQPVHMAGWAAWNDTLEKWEFGTLGLPGSAEYPDVPSC